MQNTVMLHIVIGVNVILGYPVDDIIVRLKIIPDTPRLSLEDMRMISKTCLGDGLMRQRLLTVMVVLGIVRYWGSVTNGGINKVLK